MPGAKAARARVMPRVGKTDAQPTPAPHCHNKTAHRHGAATWLHLADGGHNFGRQLARFPMGHSGACFLFIMSTQHIAEVQLRSLLCRKVLLHQLMLGFAMVPPVC
jgi:hypothetical protein